MSSTVDGNVGSQNQHSRLVKWNKLSIGRMKCNIDASFPNHANRFGIGMCIQDEVGAFVLAKTEWYQPKCDVHIGEPLGLLFALQCVHQLSLGPIDFEDLVIINSNAILFQGRIVLLRLRPSLPKQNSCCATFPN